MAESKQFDAAVIGSDDESSGSGTEDVFTETTICLFCPEEFTSVEKAMIHVKAVHGVCFIELKQKFKIDQYQFIKLINYIRWNSASPETIKQATKMVWDHPKYLKPKGYEPWLTFDYEENIPDELSDNGNEVTMLWKEIEKLKMTLKERTDQMVTNENIIKQMRLATLYKITENDNKPDLRATKPETSELDANRGRISKMDESYYSGYASFDIHHEMLSDVVRTINYRDALFKNKSSLHGKTVLDVGCGTGVLSIFASQAGAQCVVGVDNSTILYDAMDVVRLNNTKNVKLIKSTVEDAELPLKKFDIIISEWMGYFLMYEGMLDTVIYARDKYLKEGGILMPSHCTLHLVGFGNDDLYAKRITFWNDVYGLNMSNIREKAIQVPLIRVAEPEFILTESCIIANLDIYTVDISYSTFSTNFEMKCIKDGKLSAFVGYFITRFDLPEPAIISTAPEEVPTHWKQTIFFLDKVYELKAGDIVSGVITSRRNQSSERSLDITIEVFGNISVYSFD